MRWLPKWCTWGEVWGLSTTTKSRETSLLIQHRTSVFQIIGFFSPPTVKDDGDFIKLFKMYLMVWLLSLFCLLCFNSHAKEPLRGGWLLQERVPQRPAGALQPYTGRRQTESLSFDPLPEPDLRGTSSCMHASLWTSNVLLLNMNCCSVSLAMEGVICYSHHHAWMSASKSAVLNTTCPWKLQGKALP